MDASDASAKEGVMLAFLPTTADWCKAELPHMTLVYVGTIDKLKLSDYNTLAKDAASIAMITNRFALKVTGTEIFGDEEKVNVLRFQITPELIAIRRFVEYWNASKHPFRPHSTIGPATHFIDIIPPYVSFDRIMVGWGEESMTFWLK